MHASAKTRFILVVTAALVLSGCASIGPATVQRDRLNYMNAMSESVKGQLLLNMVKLRYGDMPSFLEIASVINSYSIESGIDLNVNWYNYPYSTNQLLRGSGKFTDRPTITYSPLTGERLTRTLMTPIPPLAVVGLIQAGYPANLVLPLCVQSINGVNNRSVTGVEEKSPAPEFFTLIEKITNIQAAGAMAWHVSKVENEDVTTLIFRDPKKLDEQLKADIMEVKKILGLDPHTNEFKVVYGSVEANDKEIAILSRSMLQIFLYVSSYFDVPERHIAEKRVGPTIKAQTIEGVPIRPPMRVYSRSSAALTAEPDDAFSAVKYHNCWFWIDDKDLPSKQAMTFLLILFSLTETGTQGMQPIVTIPAG